MNSDKVKDRMGASDKSDETESRSATDNMPDQK